MTNMYTKHNINAAICRAEGVRDRVKDDKDSVMELLEKIQNNANQKYYEPLTLCSTSMLRYTYECTYSTGYVVGNNVYLGC